MKFLATLALGAALLVPALSATAQTQPSMPNVAVLQGDEKLACEAVLCLATGQRPGECMPSIQRYFSINGKKPGDTIRERINFLNKCPASNQTPEMSALIAAQASGAGNCDAGALNRALQRVRVLNNGQDGTSETYIDNKLPAACKAYTSNAYVDGSTLGVKYVGTTERGGYWVAAADWATAQRQWEIRIAAEDAAAREKAARDLHNQGGGS